MRIEVGSGGVFNDQKSSIHAYVSTEGGKELGRLRMVRVGGGVLKVFLKCSAGLRCPTTGLRKCLQLHFSSLVSSHLLYSASAEKIAHSVKCWLAEKLEKVDQQHPPLSLLSFFSGII